MKRFKKDCKKDVSKEYDWAWQDIFYMVHTLWNGGSFRNWYLEDGVVIGNCTDGIRPVTFLIERIAIENKT